MSVADLVRDPEYMHSHEKADFVVCSDEARSNIQVISLNSHVSFIHE